MFNIMLFPDFLAFFRSLQRLYALQRGFERNAVGARQTEVIYRQELIHGLALAERFLPRLCDRAGSRTANAILRVVDRKKAQGEPQFDLAAALSAFRTVACAARKADARVFPISGTLLGLVREGGLLAHDYDLDFGIMDEDRPGYWRLIEEIQGHPDIACLRYYWPEPYAAYMNPELRHATHIPQKTSIRFHSGIVVDLGNHFAFRGNRLHGSVANIWQHKEFILRESSCLGVDIHLPEIPEIYLEENYGDWRTPVLDYVYFLDTPNWSPVLSAEAMRLYVGQALRYASRGRYRRVMRIVEECLPALKRRAMGQWDQADLPPPQGGQKDRT
jgi:hypothetical protein